MGDPDIDAHLKALDAKITAAEADLQQDDLRPAAPRAMFPKPATKAERLARAALKWSMIGWWFLMNLLVVGQAWANGRPLLTWSAATFALASAAVIALIYAGQLWQLAVGKQVWNWVGKARRPHT